MGPVDFDIDYEIWVDGEWMAGTDDESEARHYAAMYSSEGKVTVYKVFSIKTEVSL